MHNARDKLRWAHWRCPSNENELIKVTSFFTFTASTMLIGHWNVPKKQSTQLHVHVHTCTHLIYLQVVDYFDHYLRKRLCKDKLFGKYMYMQGMYKKDLKYKWKIYTWTCTVHVHVCNLQSNDQSNLNTPDIREREKKKLLLNGDCSRICPIKLKTK